MATKLPPVSPEKEKGQPVVFCMGCGKWFPKADPSHIHNPPTSSQKKEKPTLQSIADKFKLSFGHTCLHCGYEWKDKSATSQCPRCFPSNPSSQKNGEDWEQRPWFRFLKQYAAYEENGDGTATLTRESMQDQALRDITQALATQKAELIQTTKYVLETYVWDMNIGDTPTESVIENRRALNNALLDTLRVGEDGK